jgi:hypothetical protein
MNDRPLSPEPPIDWSLTTWEGSRAEQLRRWQQLTLRQRFEAVDQMWALSRRLAAMRANNAAPPKSLND